MLKILLILPDANIHKLRMGQRGISFREAPLTLTTLAALVPADIPSEVVLIDQNVQPLTSRTDFSLVGISCLTGTAPRAYALADHYRSLGIPVVLGGVHATLRPEEAAKHADCLMTGPAEKTWPLFLREFYQTGRYQPIYKGVYNGYAGQPLPRRELQAGHGYMSPYTVAATRGCKGSCDFCSIPAVGSRWAVRPVEEVIDEIRRIPSRRFVFNDVSLLEDREYAMELFTALTPLKKSWGGLCTTKIGKDGEMLELMARSGCIYLLLGMESINARALGSINKGFNRPEEYTALMQKLHSNHITVQGCFIFGFDNDTPETVSRTVDWVNELKIDIPRYAIYTPYPGTSAFKRLKLQGRILHEHWAHYDTQHVVFQPAWMSPAELDAHFLRAWKRTFSMPSILKRMTRRSKHLPITFLGNLAYRMYVRRLHRDKHRVYHARGLR